MSPSPDGEDQQVRGRCVVEASAWGASLLEHWGAGAYFIERMSVLHRKSCPKATNTSLTLDTFSGWGNQGVSKWRVFEASVWGKSGAREDGRRYFGIHRLPCIWTRGVCFVIVCSCFCAVWILALYVRSRVRCCMCFVILHGVAFVDGWTLAFILRASCMVVFVLFLSAHLNF